MTIALLCVAALLVGCGGGTKNNDTLVFGRGSDSVGLDPALETDGESFKVCDNIYETLVGYDSVSTAVVPQLAHAWDVTADQLTWTLPFPIYGIFRYLYLVHQQDGGGSPSEMLLRDRPLLACVGLWAAVIVLIIYRPLAG